MCSNECLDLPDVLLFNNGKKVKPETFEARRQELIEILGENVYGHVKKAYVASGKVISSEKYAAGNVKHDNIEISFNTEKGEFSFPLHIFTPNAVKKPPLILHIAFRSQIPDKYYPIEEICDNGFATAFFCYADISADAKNTFDDGLSAKFNGDNRKGNEWGKIGMWAYAASRAMDYLTTLDTIDTRRIAVAGHSRLGKTALWAGALDVRFFAAISNDSGCSGAALSKGKTGERIEDITNVFGYWFCDNYKHFSGKDDDLPFDQHFLIAAIAPRYVYVCSAETDLWADPKNEYLSCVAASKAYNLLGLKGFVAPSNYPDTVPCVFNEGEIGYHIRKGDHYMSRYDWNKYIEFLKQKQIIIERKEQH